MGILLLLIAFVAIGIAFWRAAGSLLRYYKQLQSYQGGSGDALTEIHPHWYGYLKFVLPIVIGGFYFCAISAALAFFYVVIRYLIDHL